MPPQSRNGDSRKGPRCSRWLPHGGIFLIKSRQQFREKNGKVVLVRRARDMCGGATEHSILAKTFWNCFSVVAVLGTKLKPFQNERPLTASSILKAHGILENKKLLYTGDYLDFESCPSRGNFDSVVSTPNRREPRTRSSVVLTPDACNEVGVPPASKSRHK